MSIDIRRRAQVGVPEQFLNELQVASFLVDDSGGGCGTPQPCANERSDVAGAPFGWSGTSTENRPARALRPSLGK
jgi:hypothetical protein